MLIQCSCGGAGGAVVDVVSDVLVVTVDEVDDGGATMVVSVPDDVHDTTNSETNSKKANEIDAAPTKRWILIPCTIATVLSADETPVSDTSLGRFCTTGNVQ